jgi:hypothetical protein
LLSVFQVCLVRVAPKIDLTMAQMAHLRFAYGSSRFSVQRAPKSF